MVMQVLIGNALQNVFPPNTTLVSIVMEQQLSDDTVTVACSFIIWQSMIPILLANRCCALEVLYLQHAVERVMPGAVGMGVVLMYLQHALSKTAAIRQPLLCMSLAGQPEAA